MGSREPRLFQSPARAGQSEMLKALVLVCVLAYLGLAAIAYLVSDRMIFLPPRSSYTPGQLPIVHVEAGAGVRIATLHLPNPEARLTLLYSHGNAEDLGHLSWLLEETRRAGFSVIGYDYRGYGLSSGGPPSARGAFDDLHAVYRYATEQLGIPPARIVLLGRSVGSGPATELAAREPVGGLVVESGFVSAFRVMTRVQLLPFDRFPNLRHIRHVRCPVLVIHGGRDEVIPPSHGRRLHAAAAEPKRLLVVEDAGHNDLVQVAGERYWRALRELEELVVAAAP